MKQSRAAGAVNRRRRGARRCGDWPRVFSVTSLPAEVQRQRVVSLDFPGPTQARQLFARLAVAPRIDELRACHAAGRGLEPLLDDRRA